MRPLLDSELRWLRFLARVNGMLLFAVPVLMFTAGIFAESWALIGAAVLNGLQNALSIWVLSQGGRDGFLPQEK